MKAFFELKYRKIPVLVSVKSHLKIAEFTFIVDTGASYSILDKNFLKSLGFTPKDYTKTVNLQGIGGKISQVPFLKVHSIQAIGLTRQNFEIGLYNFAPNAFYEGILGIDFFLNHALTIDFKRAFIEVI